MRVTGPKEPDSNVKSLAIWAIGRLGPDACLRAKKTLVRALIDPYWKVRTTACMSVASMGPAIADDALPNLTKILKEGIVNRQTVSESIIALGIKGEQALL